MENNKETFDIDFTAINEVLDNDFSSLDEAINLDFTAIDKAIKYKGKKKKASKF